MCSALEIHAWHGADATYDALCATAAGTDEQKIISAVELRALLLSQCLVWLQQKTVLAKTLEFGGDEDI